MSERHFFLQRLDLPDDADERSIRRAYARELKLIDQEADPAGFQSLREAYDIALMWSRRRPDEDDEDIPPPASASAAPAEAMAPPTPETATTTAAAAEPPPAPAEEQPPAIDEGALGGAVFSEFLERCHSLAGERAITDAAVWEQALRAGLADTRLISIMAREVYEYNVAALLAHGWQPGHEALLIAAIQVFQWDQDRRRVLSLGQAGHMLDTAIDQRTMFDLQSEAEQERQRKLVQRLREPKEPSTRELVIHSATIETMIARFPEWLALIVSVPTVVHWRERNEQVPNWRRKLTFTGRRKLSEKTAEIQGGGFNWGWLVFLVIMGLSRLASHASHDSAGNDSSGRPATPYTDTRANDLIDQGNKQLDASDYDGAISTYTDAAKIAPRDARPIANRAMAHFYNNQFRLAELDIKQALQLDAGNAIVPRVRGLLSIRDKRYQDALADFTRAIQLDRDNAFCYSQRALAYEGDGQPGQALSDALQSIQLQPKGNASAYYIAARMHQALGQQDKAKALAEALIATAPDTANVYTAAAQIYMRLKQPKAALAMLDRGAKVAPDVTLNLYRANLLPAADLAGRRAAIAAALAIDPKSSLALQMRADLEASARNYPLAIEAITAAIEAEGAASPDHIRLLLDRGIIRAQQGQGAAAQADFAAARDATSNATELNNVCWHLATHNVALQTALDDCNAALAKDPKHVQAWDSKGFVLLRIGRYDAAVAAYDAALALSPQLPHSLFGRGVARHRLGKQKEGEADIKAALRADDSIDKQFAAYGLTP
jgi:tetratricopeptide (TPR) repeat protein